MRVANPVDLIIIRDDRILLCTRTETEQGFEGTWSIPGGGPLPSETIEEALHREIAEELGCSIKVFSYFRSYVVAYDDLLVRSFYFYGDIEGDIVLNEELSEYRWFAIDDPALFERDFAFNQKDVVRDFIAFWEEQR
ncbi:MAG: NUDIX hydrolase [Candidatus Woesearchaeota archaeon]